eukprot:GHRR01022451.1.p1 GENE.GHRR01022451.1~~GHRR01022451.1.p1  ORF type:complete len:150 (-),score=40.23 GHRR01022451.1:1138-1587(-)
MPLLLLLQMQPRLSAGAGWSGRNAESGMLLINRHQWLEVLHWVFWINSWADKLYQKLLHGDKDTFALGFALAGAASSYRQVVMPPGGAFWWDSTVLEVKWRKTGNTTCPRVGGWSLLGALQHDNTGVSSYETLNPLQLFAISNAAAAAA